MEPVTFPLAAGVPRQVVQMPTAIAAAAPAESACSQRAVGTGFGEPSGPSSTPRSRP